jgi:acyl-CoA reductase-like NAD-dependent aldehyde dehydrogenase
VTAIRTTATGEHLAEYQLYIDGEEQPARSGRTYQTIDPFTGQPWAVVPDSD